jgi:hypothetical protein
MTNLQVFLLRPGEPIDGGAAGDQYPNAKGEQPGHGK